MTAHRSRAPLSRQRSRDAVNAPRRSMELYLEFGGGLGDIFYQMFHDGGYDALQTLTPQDSAVTV